MFLTKEAPLEQSGEIHFVFSTFLVGNNHLSISVCRMDEIS